MASLHSGSNISDWIYVSEHSAKSYLLKKKERLYAYLGLAALSFISLILTCFLPAFAPILWDIMFLTPTGITLAGGMFLGLTIGLSGFVDMWNHRAKSFEEMQLALSHNRSFHLLTVGPIVLIVGLFTVFSLIVAFPLLTPFILSITTISAVSTILLAGMHFNIHSGISIFYSFAEKLIGIAPLIEDLSSIGDNQANSQIDKPASSKDKRQGSGVPHAGQEAVFSFLFGPSGSDHANEPSAGDDESNYSFPEQLESVAESTFLVPFVPR